MIEVLAFLEHWRPSHSSGTDADGAPVGRPVPRIVSDREAAAAPVAASRPAPGLKAAMRHLAGAVSVVTAGVGDERTGATVTSAHSLSLEPETMLVSINLASSTFPVIERYGHFCVNILEAGQIAVADRFAGRGGLKGPERYAGARWSALATGAFALDGALASVDCEVEEIVRRHSHALVFGAVRAVRTGVGDALLYSHGRYGSLAAPDGAPGR